MERRIDEEAAARHELVLAMVLLVAVARLAEGPGAWLVVGLALLAGLAATFGVLARRSGRGRVPGLAAALLVPGVLVAGAAAAIRLVPVGLGLVPALALVALLLDRAVRLEGRLLRQPAGASAHDRSLVQLAIVVAAFVAFAGVAALVGDGAAAGAGEASAAPLELVALAVADGVAALLLGFRAAALRAGSPRATLLSALTYGAVVAIAALAVRAIDLPGLAGPAVLTLVLYLWDALHPSAPSRVRGARFVWETALLVVLGVVVVAWNLRLEG